MDEIEEVIRNTLPKNILTQEQFNEIKTLSKSNALKYIKEHTDLSLKESAVYYDFYYKENYDD